MADAPTVERLRSVGLAAGLDAVGVAPATPFTGTRHDLDERKAAGLHGGMEFTYRNPARSTDPGRVLAGARALVVGARSYARRPPVASADGRRATGRVAAYAWHDHYADLRAGLQAVAAQLEAAGWQARVVADDNALVDREAAVRAGLGWYGKNANVLLPGQGSWFVLGSVVTDAPLAATPDPVPDGCGTCRRCLDGCPTGAIVAPGVVDARRCLAWLAQAPGDFPEELRPALGDRIYGCDDCQEVCPVNRRSTDEQDLPAAEADARARLDLVELLEADDDTLLARHGRWYIADRNLDHLRRNALVAIGNVGAGDPRARAVAERYLHADDPMLRRHAAWAVARLEVA